MSTRADDKHTKKKRTRARGYTAVEVLSAMTLFAIGAAGVIGMQRVTIQGGDDARRYDMATNLAHEWLSRLQRDSVLWTEPNASSPTTINLTNTRWLTQVGTCPNFCTPPAATPAEGRSGSFDIFGRDLLATDTSAHYCAQYRLEWITPPGTPPLLNTTSLMRAEVRVFWARSNRAPIGDCASATPNAANADEIYHFVYATSSVRENPLR